MSEVQEEAKEPANPEVDIAKMVNAAVTKQLTPALSKALKPIIEQMAAIAAPKEEEAKPEKGTDALENLRKEFDAYKRKSSEKEKAALQQARVATTRNELSELVKGKVLPDWQDIAIDRLMAKVNLEGDKPQYDLGEYHGSLTDGIEAFTKDPANKRFLPAPKPVIKSGQQQQTYNPQQSNSNGSNGLSYEDKLGEIASGLMSGDITFVP